MVKNLFIKGCSFLQIYDNRRCPTTAGHKLAETMGLNPIGYAAAGRGNDRILTTTKLFFYDYPELIKDTFVLIGWSHVVRNDYLLKSSVLTKSPKEGFCPSGKRKAWKDRQWQTWKFTTSIKKRGVTGVKPTLPKGYSVDKNLRLRYLHQVLSMQDFLKLKGINYCMYNALTNRYRPGGAKGLYRLADEVDQKRFFQFDGESHLEFVQNSTVEPQSDILTLSKTDDHPSAKGHSLWADKLYSFIKENNLL